MIYFYNLYKCMNKELFNNKNIEEVAIGNHVSSYFYLLGFAFAKYENFVYKECKKEIYKNLFIKDFPDYINIEEHKDIYEKLKNNNIFYYFFYNYSPYSLWNINDDKCIIYWNIMKPLIQKILNDAFIKNNLNKEIKYPIIHFRCSDSPFDKSYEFSKYSFFKDALENIKNTTNLLNDNKKIIILFNNKHRSKNKEMNACNIYANDLINYINSLGYEAILESGTLTEDFVKMFYAPAVITTTSSYSFMSGYFGYGKFIVSRDCDKEFCYRKYALKHFNVKDYYNTDEVIKKLREY